MKKLKLKTKLTSWRVLSDGWHESKVRKQHLTAELIMVLPVKGEDHGKESTVRRISA